ncbi:MAG: thiolase domain-containing protein, partial [Candidatus Diapherotrites archaeon]|nr:thiolase domain-containing protein [Candidatus Diapherotrites archaeon]
MRSVSIIGAGCTPFGEHWDRSFRELAVEAGTAAIKDSGVMEKSIESLSVGCMASGRLVGQEHVGALVADQLGLNPIPASRHEAACASGSVALRAAYQSIASGTHECALVLGVEKMTEVSTDDVSTALGGAGDQETELFHGATFPALYALLARAHMQAYGTTEEQMAAVSVKNHANAAQNPFAQFQKPITIEQVLHSAYVASPLKLLDCSPITDG